MPGVAKSINTFSHLATVVCCVLKLNFVFSIYLSAIFAASSTAPMPQLVIFCKNEGAESMYVCIWH